MAYYHICPKCGAHLDPGEKCDCREKEEKFRKQEEEIRKVIRTERSGQMVLVL